MTPADPQPDRLKFDVTREVEVPAHPAAVWHFLSTDEGWSAWWGAGSTIDARPGGSVRICYPNGQTASGQVREAEPGRMLVFSFGYDAPDTILPAGSSIVEIELVAQAASTVVKLCHRVPDATVADHHVAGWRYQVGLFASLVGRAALAGDLAAHADAWHEAWMMTDPGARRRALDAVVAPDVEVHEPMASIRGVDDLDAWIEQVQSIMPATVRRTGPPALTGASATWDWEISAAEQVIATGRTVATTQPDGRFSTVTAFWLTGPPNVPTSVVGAEVR